MGTTRGGTLALVAAVCAIAAGAGGYALGSSGGPDVDKAKADGERAGRARAASTDRRSYRTGFVQGRRAGYRQAYRSAYRIAQARAKKAGQ